MARCGAGMALCVQEAATRKALLEAAYDDEEAEVSTAPSHHHTMVWQVGAGQGVGSGGGVQGALAEGLCRIQ